MYYVFYSREGSVPTFLMVLIYWRNQTINLVECSMFCIGLISSLRCWMSASMPCTFCELVINLKPWLDSGSADQQGCTNAHGTWLVLSAWCCHLECCWARLKVPPAPSTLTSSLLLHLRTVLMSSMAITSTHYLGLQNAVGLLVFPSQCAPAHSGPAHIFLMSECFSQR